MIKVIATDRFFAGQVPEVKSIFEGIDIKCSECHYVNIKKDTDEKLYLEYVQDADIAIVGEESYSRDFLAQCKNLKLIVIKELASAGVDLKACKDLGIKVLYCNQPEIRGKAEYVIATIFHYSMELYSGYQRLVNNHYYDGFDTGITGAKIGVIGKQKMLADLVSMCNPFHAKISYYTEERDKELEEQLGIYYRELNSLLKENDYLIYDRCEVAGFDLKEEILEKINPNAILISLSGSKGIDMDALMNLLDDECLVGACLDINPDEMEDLREFTDLYGFMATPKRISRIKSVNHQKDIFAAKAIVDYVASLSDPSMGRAFEEKYYESLNYKILFSDEIHSDVFLCSRI